MAHLKSLLLPLVWVVFISTAWCTPEKIIDKDGTNSSQSFKENSTLSLIETTYNKELMTSTNYELQGTIPETVKSAQIDDNMVKSIDRLKGLKTMKTASNNAENEYKSAPLDIKLSDGTYFANETDNTDPLSYKIPNPQKMSPNISSLQRQDVDAGFKSVKSLTTEINVNAVDSFFVTTAAEPNKETGHRVLNLDHSFATLQPLLEANLVLLVPESEIFMFSRRRIITALDIAQENLYTSGITSNFRIRFLFGNSQCSEILGPIRAFEFFWKEQVDAFLGPACDYSVAPVARYAAYWQVPVLSPGALSFDFETNKISQYRSLTRVGASLSSVALLLTDAMKRYGWGKVLVVYDPGVDISNIPRLCFLAASTIAYISKRQGFEANPEFSGDPEKVLRSKVGTEYAGK